MNIVPLFVMASFLLATNALQSQIPGRWYRVDVECQANLQSVVAIPPSTFVAVGGNGTMLRSFDNGRTWSQHGDLVNHAVNFSAIAASTSGAVVAVADDGTVASGVPNGAVALRKPADATEWTAVAYSDVHHVLIAGRDPVDGTITIMRSTNDGDSFDEVARLESDVAVASMKFIAPEVGFIVGAVSNPSGPSHGIVFRTTDGGVSWTRVATSSMFECVTSVAMAGAEILAVGVSSHFNGSILRSTNMGESWEIEPANDLAMVGSIVPLSEETFLASGVRMTLDMSGETELVFTTTFVRSNGGQSWNIVDVEDGFYGLTSAAATTNHIVMVGDSGRVWIRWHDHEANSIFQVHRRHVEFGTMRTQRDTTVERVVSNTGVDPVFVRQAQVVGAAGLSFIVDPVGVTLYRGQALDLQLRRTPTGEGNQWSAVILTMSNGVPVVVHVSATVEHGEQRSCITDVSPSAVLYESFSPIGESIFSGDLFSNTSGSQRVVRSIRFEGEDNLAFALADPEMLPYDVEPNQAFGCMVRFTGLAPGVYRSMMVIETDACVVRVPIVGYVRMSAWQDAIPVSGAEQNVASVISVLSTTADWYQHATPGAPQNLGAPFRVMRAETERMNPFTKHMVDVEFVPRVSGLVGSRCDISWEFMNGARWTSRTVLVANVRPSEPTSVDDQSSSYLEVRPNPVQESLRVVDAQATGWVSLRVVNSLGVLVTSRHVFCNGDGLNVALPAQNWAPGLYVVEVASANGVRRQRVVRSGD